VISSPAWVGEQVHSETLSSAQPVNPNGNGGVGDRTLSRMGRAEPSGEFKHTDSIETSTDNLTLHKRTSR
jgi:hypothetical protein